MAQTVIIDVSEKMPKRLTEAKNASDRLGASLARTKKQVEALERDKVQIQIEIKDLASRTIMKINERLYELIQLSQNTVFRFSARMDGSMQEAANSFKMLNRQITVKVGVDTGALQSLNMRSYIEKNMGGEIRIPPIQTSVTVSVKNNTNTNGIIDGIAAGIISKLSMVQNFAKGLSSGIAKALGVLVPDTKKIFSGLQGLLSDLASKTKEVFSKVASSVASLFGELTNTISGFLGSIVGATHPVASLVVQGFGVAFGAVSNLAIGIAKTAVSVVSSAVSKVGAEIMNILGIDFSAENVFNTYKDFDQNMSNVKAAGGGATDEEMAAFEEKARSVGTTTTMDAPGAANAMVKMREAGWNKDEVLDQMDPIVELAEASGMDLGSAADLATGSMAVLGLEADNTREYLDMIAATASKSKASEEELMQAFQECGGVMQAYNIPMEEASGLMGVLANRGVKGAAAGNALNSIFMNLTDQTGDAAAALKELKINPFDDATGEFKGYTKLLEEINEKTKDMEQDEKIDFFEKLGGKGQFANMEKLLSGVGDELNGITDSAVNSSGALAEMADIKTDNLQGDVNSLLGSVDDMKLSLMSSMEPGIRGMIQAFGGLLPGISTVLSGIGEQAGVVLQGISDRIKGLADNPEFQNADFFGKAQIAWDEVIMNPFSEWWDGTGKSKIMDFVKNIGKGFGQVIMAVFDIDWFGVLGGLFEAVGSFFSGLFEKLNPKKLWESHVKKSEKKLEKQQMIINWGLEKYDGKLPTDKSYYQLEDEWKQDQIEKEEQAEEKVTAEKEKQLSIEEQINGLIERRAQLKQDESKVHTAETLVEKLQQLIDESKTELTEEQRETNKQQILETREELAGTELMSGYADVIRNPAYTDESALEISQKVLNGNKQRIDSQIESMGLEANQNLGVVVNKLHEAEKKKTELTEKSDKIDKDRESLGTWYQQIQDYKNDSSLMEIERNDLINAAWRSIDDAFRRVSLEPPDRNMSIDEMQVQHGDAIQSAKLTIFLERDQVELDLENSQEQVQGYLETIYEYADLLARNNGLGSLEEMMGKAGTFTEKDAENAGYIVTMLTNALGLCEDIAVPRDVNFDFTMKFKTEIEAYEASTDGGSATGVTDTKKQQVGKNASGGILNKPQISLVAEAGPEAIIPLSGTNKHRGVSLWEKTGQLLGLLPQDGIGARHASGGIFGTGNGHTPQRYLPTGRPEGDGAPAGAMPVSISLGGMNFTFNGGAADKEGIMQTIRQEMPEVADEVASAIAEALQRLFPNMQPGLV